VEDDQLIRNRIILAIAAQKNHGMNALQLSQGLNITHKAAGNHLRALERQGVLESEPAGITTYYKIRV
jgi:predicted ArsR family transcriptional regulator